MKQAGAFVACLIVAACMHGGGEPADEPVAPISHFLTATDLSGYARALEGRSFEFPLDHNSHPRFKTEWWYFTGNLLDRRQHRFGFQLTFFRFALAPGMSSPTGSAWRSRQAWMAHLAITSAADGRFVHAERFSREALGLAGNSADPFRLWLEDWSATSAGTEPFPLRLQAGTPDAALDLTLVATKPPVSHGDHGLDRKGPEAGNASLYYSVPRLATSGELRIDGARYAVSGSAWMDREWSTNALSPELEGWDWLAVELSDGRDLMFYRLRAPGGGASPFSSGSLIAGDGSATTLGREDVVLEAREYWTSPATGTRYPVGWTVSLPAQALRLEIRPLIPNQEMDLSVRYWEGAVLARGSRAGAAITGRGYLELTGY